MKLLLIAACSVVVLTSCGRETEVSGADTEKRLFNGVDLDGWSHVLVGEGVKRGDVWHVEDGVLVCKGQPLGYLFTDDSYQDFTLSFDWRWAPGKEPGNSGVLLRIQGAPNGFMPKCVEAQLKSGSAGDIWAFFGAKAGGDAERAVEVKDHKDLGNFHGFKAMKQAEKPPGEWNRYELRCAGDELELRINGELVNRANGLETVSGPIALQSEGAEIHFRNIEVKKIQ